LLSLVYEILLLIAIVLLAGGIAAALAHITNPELARTYTQIIALPTCTAYFAWQWCRGGQTLPMKTWRMRIETADGSRITPPRALLRIALAIPGYTLLCTSVIWAFFDRDGQFLHDRLAGTRLVSAEKPPAPQR
jgi:uncharacterized RDD family membrane protein YckC